MKQIRSPARTSRPFTPAMTRWLPAGIRLRGLLTGVAALLACVPMQQASAELMWAIDDPTISYSENYDPFNPGHEMRLTYVVRNQSDIGDANNLIHFSLAGISDMRIFGATVPNNWIWSYNTNNHTITFSGNGAYISPNGSGIFRIFSYNTQTADGTANAVAEGNPTPENFPSQSVPIPVIPEPMTLVDTFSTPDFTNVFLTMTFSNVVSQTTTIQAATGLLPPDWHSVTSFPSRPGVTNLVIPLPGTSSPYFIRLSTDRFP